MRCPECYGKLIVVDSRAAENNSTRRRLECTTCKTRFTSYETIREISAEQNEPALDIDEMFLKMAKKAIMQNTYTSALTGGTYPTLEEALIDTIAELKRLHEQ